MHITVFLCPVFFRSFYCALCQRNFNHPRLVRPLRVCRARCHRGGFTKHRSSGPSPFSASSLLSLITTISFLAFCLPRPPCHTLHSHISLLHSSCSLSSLPAPVTSSSSIMCHLPPLCSH